MNFYRSILSLLLLSAYALLLLHDFIPHTHHTHQGDIQISSEVHHSHEDYHHSHEHHEEKGKDDQSTESSDNNSFGEHLIQAHSHSVFDGHQHDLVYRAAAKDKLISQVVATPYLGENLWKIPDRLDRDNSWQLRSQPPPSDPHLSSGHGLRAPPALG